MNDLHPEIEQIAAAKIESVLALAQSKPRRPGHKPVDDIGLEVEGDNGEVIATVEIAWPDHKIGFMTKEQLKDKEMLEQKGWRFLDTFNVAEAKSWFGGEA